MGVVISGMIFMFFLKKKIDGMCGGSKRRMGVVISGVIFMVFFVVFFVFVLKGLMGCVVR